MRHRHSLKYNVLFCFLLLLVDGCKKDDPVPPCKFSFKGTAYNLAIATCEESSGEMYLYGQDATSNPSRQLTIIKGTTTATDQLQFILIMSDLDTYYTTVNNASTPTITISGKTWTFSGTVENTSGDTGDITGTCTCK